LEAFDFVEVNELYLAMEAKGEDEIRRAAVKAGDIKIERGLDMRYVGQEHAVSVDIPVEVFSAHDLVAIKRLFDAVHLKRYGYCSDKERAEVVSIRTSISGEMPKPTVPELVAGEAEPEVAPSRRLVYFTAEDGWQDARIYQRQDLRRGNRIAGPALVEEYASTTVIFPGDELTVDKFGNLVIEVANDEN
jgi:N-methylhydantoinase A